jgi:hypothetical protein
MTENKRTKQEVAKDKFFAFLRATSLADDIDREHIHLGSIYGRNYLLLGWSHQPYDEAIKAVREIRPEVSEKTVGRELAQSMVKLFHQHNIKEDTDSEADAPVLESILRTLDSSAVNKEFANLLELLKYRIKAWTAFVFLEGVELKGLRELPLGITTLYPKERGPLQDALDEMRSSERWSSIARDIESSAGHCCCYLTLDIEGEKDFVSQKALDQAQDIASILNLYIVSSPDRTSFYQSVGILGQPTTTRRRLSLQRTPPVAETAPSPSYSFSVQLPPARRHEVGSSQVQRWKEHGLDKVLECVQSFSSTPGSAESRIHNAVIWYGRAMDAYSEDEQFVGLIVALESLLVAEKN